jgi:hypothetical protein
VSEDTPQNPSTSQPVQGRHGITIPPSLDPRRAIEPATVERMLRAQEAARAQATAATTIVVSTIVSLITSAFGFVAALAWNTAIQTLLKNRVEPALRSFKLGPSEVALLYAFLVTLLAIVVVLIMGRIASRWVKRSALDNSTKPEHALL